MVLLVLLAMDPWVAVAPTPAELQDHLRTLETRLQEADSAAQALRQAHNTLGEHLAAGGACTDEMQTAAGRTPELGARYRDQAQAARAQRDRLERLTASEALAPLVEGFWKDRIDQARSRVDAHRGAYLEMAAWQKSIVQPYLRRCGRSSNRKRSEPASR